jgi:hypothetical protein
MDSLLLSKRKYPTKEREIAACGRKHGIRKISKEKSYLKIRKFVIISVDKNALMRFC